MTTYNQPLIDTSLRAMSTEVRNLLAGGKASDDFNISLRQIDRAIKDIYSDLIHQEDRQKQSIGEPLDTQRVVNFCIPLVDNDDFNCVCTQYSGKLKKAQLPKLVQWKGEPYIKFLGNSKRTMEFTPTTGIGQMDAYLLMVDKPAYFVVGNTAYVALPKKYVLICDIGLQGIPVDPMVTSSDKICFDIWSQEWNISDHMRNIVKKQALELFGNPLTTNKQNNDVRNNAQDGNQFTTIQS